MMQASKWHSCYDEGWKDIIVPEAFSHPAKMAYGLLKRILEHAKIQGWLKEGDVILDPFGGIGSTGILGAYEGYQCVCCELEQKFVDLAKKNFELHLDAWVEFGHPFPVIIQGDSRQLCQIVEKADCIVSSPPFSERRQPASVLQPGGRQGCHKGYHNAGKSEVDNYGQTKGQLGSMKPGKVDMVVSSPPFSTGDTASAQSMVNRQDKSAKWVKENCGSACTKGYGQTSGNLGNLKSGDVDAIISSPPYEGSVKPCPGLIENKAKYYDKVGGRNRYREARSKTNQGGYENGYSESKNNLGNQQGDTFWQAAKEIVQQCHQILRPGGHAIWVVKSFVRNKKIVDFPGDWQRLCESVGFKTVCVHHAMLVKETTHQTLFGDTEIKRKERKSFFRRLAESKGSPRIDYEVVLCMSKE